MATLAVNSVVPAGTAVALAAAAGGGDTFPGTGRETLIVTNGSGASINVTLATFKTVNGLAVPSRVVAVAAGATKHIAVGPEHVDPADGNVDVTYSDVTTVTVGVTRRSD